MARRRIESWCGAALAVLVVVQPLALAAAEHLVRMRTETEAGRFRFEPPLVFIAPGDDVRFVPDTRLHGVKSIAGMLPAGATRWRGRRPRAPPAPSRKARTSRSSGLVTWRRR